MTKQVYTMGYIGKKMPEIQEIARQLEAVIFDVRFSPYSRNPAWNAGNFRKVFGRRYKHVKAFGNAAYKEGGTRIVDFDAGRKLVEASGRPVILLCACRTYEECHRSVLAARLRELGFQVEEYKPREQLRFC